MDVPGPGTFKGVGGPGPPMTDGGVLDRLRRPAYTGSNRCYPCTIVNIVIAVVLASALLVGGLLLRLEVWLAAGMAIVILAVSLGAVALRGYLVPGTPWLTRNYLPAPVFRWFEARKPGGGVATQASASASASTPTASPSTPSSSGASAPIEDVLERAGVVTECADVDDLCLAPSFERAWFERIESIRDAEVERTAIADLLGMEVEALSIERFGDPVVARFDGRDVGQWPSRAAFLADAAAAETMPDWLDGWDDLAVDRKGHLLQATRAFLERCPACDGPVSIGEEAVRSCCRSIPVGAVTCDACGDRLLEVALE